MSGLSPSYIQFIETEERNPTIKTIKKVAAALGASLDELYPKHDLNTKNGVREWARQLGKQIV